MSALDITCRHVVGSPLLFRNGEFVGGTSAGCRGFDLIVAHGSQVTVRDVAGQFVAFGTPPPVPIDLVDIHFDRSPPGHRTVGRDGRYAERVLLVRIESVIGSFGRTDTHIGGKGRIEHRFACDAGLAGGLEEAGRNVGLQHTPGPFSAVEHRFDTGIAAGIGHPRNRGCPFGREGTIGIIETVVGETVEGVPHGHKLRLYCVAQVAGTGSGEPLAVECRIERFTPLDIFFRKFQVDFQAVRLHSFDPQPFREGCPADGHRRIPHPGRRSCIGSQQEAVYPARILRGHPPLIELSERRAQFDRHGMLLGQRAARCHKVQVDGVTGAPHPPFGPDKAPQPLLHLFARDIERRGRKFRPGIHFKVGALFILRHHGIVGSSLLIPYRDLSIAVRHTPADRLSLEVVQFDPCILYRLRGGDTVHQEEHLRFTAGFGHHAKVTDQQITFHGFVEVVAWRAGVVAVAPAVVTPVVPGTHPVIAPFVELFLHLLETHFVLSLRLLGGDAFRHGDTGESCHRTVEREDNAVHRSGFGFHQGIQVERIGCPMAQFLSSTAIEEDGFCSHGSRHLHQVTAAVVREVTLLKELSDGGFGDAEDIDPHRPQPHSLEGDSLPLGIAIDQRRDGRHHRSSTDKPHGRSAVFNDHRLFEGFAQCGAVFGPHRPFDQQCHGRRRLILVKRRGVDIEIDHIPLNLPYRHQTFQTDKSVEVLSRVETPRKTHLYVFLRLRHVRHRMQSQSAFGLRQEHLQELLTGVARFFVLDRQGQLFVLFRGLNPRNHKGMGATVSAVHPVHRSPVEMVPDHHLPNACRILAVGRKERPFDRKGLVLFDRKGGQLSRGFSRQGLERERELPCFGMGRQQPFEVHPHGIESSPFESTLGGKYQFAGILSRNAPLPLHTG